MKHMALCASTLTTLLLTSCTSNGQLTRGNAKEILDKVAAAASTTSITIGKEQILRLQAKATGQAKGLSEIKASKICLPDPSDARVATGQFVYCGTVVPPDVTWQQPGVLVTFDKPFKWTLLEVTGISDGQSPSEKIVEYTWAYDLSHFSSEIQDALKQEPRTGKSLLRLYDDGWRFVKFE